MQKVLFRKYQGHQYTKVWPLRRELAPLFIENRVVNATAFAIKIMPAVALMSLVIQLQVLGQQFLGPLLHTPFTDLVFTGTRFIMARKTC